MTEKKSNGEQMVTFVSPTSSSTLKPGEAETHGLKEAVGGYFVEPFESVKSNWENVFAQINEMIDTATPKSFNNYNLDTIEIGLEFDGRGKLAFIAEGGAKANIKVVIKRK